MPGTDGVEATRRIMGESPCAILVVTATVAGHLSKVYQAMGYGALDAIDTPTLGPRGEIAGAALLLHKIEIIGKLVGKPAERPRSSARAGDYPIGPASFALQVRAVARSLGGPGSLDRRPPGLAEVLSRLPAALEAGIIIVQHVDAAFAPGLGQWLSEQSQRPCQLATEGHRPAVGEVLLSGTDDHLILGEDRRPALFGRAQG